MAEKIDNDKINEIKSENHVINFAVFSDDGNDAIRNLLTEYSGNLCNGNLDNPDIFAFNANDRLSYISSIKVHGSHFNRPTFLISYIYNPENPDDYASVSGTIDGAIIVVDAVDGFSQKHDEILKICLENDIRPLLFVNNVEKLINDDSTTVIDFQEKFLATMFKFNDMILTIIGNEHYTVDIQEGTVAFGSISENWLINTPRMIFTGVTLFDIINYHRGVRTKELYERVPFTEGIMEMNVRYIFNEENTSEPPFRQL